MIAVESCARRLDTFARNLELQDKLLRLSCSTQEEVLFAMASVDGVLAPVLIDLDLCLVRDYERAVVITLRIVDVDHEVCRLTSNEEVFAHCHLHGRCLAGDQTNLFTEGHDNIELGVVDDWAHW